MKTITTTLALTLALTAMATPALAGEYMSSPVMSGSDSVRYFKGVPSITRMTRDAVITITPLANDHGRPAFAILYENRGAVPVNFGLANISAMAAGVPVPVLTKQQLAQKAANAAAWARFGSALVAGLANVDYGSTTTTGWAGGRMFSATTTGYHTNNWAARQDMKDMNANIDASMEARLADAAENVIDMTTVDPGSGYGGKIVLDKPKARIWPAPVTLTVNGQAFEFTMTK
jgi:hypothetical protein